MIVSFADRGTEDIYDGLSTAQARRRCPQQIWGGAQRKLDLLNRAAFLQDLRALPKNVLKKLKGDRSGQHSIRINDQYRICFVWTSQGPADVEITDYH